MSSLAGGVSVVRLAGRCQCSPAISHLVCIRKYACGSCFKTSSFNSQLASSIDGSMATSNPYVMRVCAPSPAIVYHRSSGRWKVSILFLIIFPSQIVCFVCVFASVRSIGLGDNKIETCLVVLLLLLLLLLSSLRAICFSY